MKLPSILEQFGQKSLAIQGMVLLGIFLFFELGFCGSLFFLERSAELEVQRETHYKEILEKTQMLQKLSFESMDSLKKYAQTSDPEMSKSYDESSAETLKILDWLKKQFRELKQKECSKDLAKIDKVIRRAHKMLRFTREQFENGGFAQAVTSLKIFGDKFTPEFNAMLLDLNSLTGKEQKLVSDTHPEQRALRRNIMAVLPIGIIANVIFAVVFARFFLQTITAPIGVLLDNTQRFKANKDLNKPIQGADELMKLDESFHDMADTVREMQKMKQAFVAMISHDLRTPLANVQTYLNLITEGIFPDVDPQIMKGAKRQETNVARLIRLINDLLTLEKMESGNLQMVCKVIYLENVIEKSIEAVDEYAKKQKLTLNYQETNAEVNADPDRLIQVLINLLSNAIKFSPEGGTIEIKTVEIDSSIEVQVIDQGRGVPAEYRDIIFEKYKQVSADDDKKKGGTGLGLPICKMIIEQSGGTIGVRSEEGKGSTFWFKLPLVSDGGTAEKTAELQEKT